MNRRCPWSLVYLVVLMGLGTGIQHAPGAEDELDLLRAMTTRPGAGENYPVLPSVPSALREEIRGEMRASTRVGQAWRGLDPAQRRNVDWFEAIQLLETDKAVASLQACLCHPSDDVQILALRSLGRLRDPRATPFLLIYAEYMAVPEAGSENATLHGILHETLAATLSTLTGVEVVIKGQDPPRLQEGIRAWRRWLLDQPPTGTPRPAATRGTRDGPTAANLLSWLDAEFERLATSDPHEPTLREAAQLLEQTNQSDRWTNYLKAVQLIRQTRSKAAVPLLLKYMVLHASFGSDGSVRTYVETLTLLTGEEIANPYRYQQDRVTPVRDGVLKLVQTWWLPEFERITTDFAAMSDKQLQLMAQRLMDKARLKQDSPAGQGPSAYHLYHVLYYDILHRQPSDAPSWLPEELHPRLLPHLLRFCGYESQPQAPAGNEPSHVPLAVVPLLAWLRQNGQARDLHLLAADARQSATARLVAILALYRAGEDLETKLLVELYQEETSLERRLVAILALVRAEEEDVIGSFVVPLLEDRNHEIRTAALYVLSVVCPPAALDKLERMLRGEVPRLERSALFRALGRCRSLEARWILGEHLERALDNPQLFSTLYDALSAFESSTGQRWSEAGAHAEAFYVEKSRLALAWWHRERAQHLPVPSSGEEACRMFLRQVRALIPALPTRNQTQLAALTKELVDARRFRALRQSYGEVGRRLADSRAAGESEAAILHGTLADLDRAGEGWWIEASQGGHLAGFLVGGTGRLALVRLMWEN